MMSPANQNQALKYVIAVSLSILAVKAVQDMYTSRQAARSSQQAAEMLRREFDAAIGAGANSWTLDPLGTRQKAPKPTEPTEASKNGR